MDPFLSLCGGRRPPPVTELKFRKVFRGSTGSSFEHDRHWPVVDKLDGHAGSEDASRDLEAVVLERAAESLVERLGALGRRGMRKARAIALRRVLKASDVNRRMESR
jgi:hypothetical protein